jgi:predicted amidohydrolase
MTDYLIRAALWQIPTMVINANKPVPELESSKLTMNAMNNLAAHERFRLLEDQVADAVLAFARRPPAAGEKVVDLFVAPEYLFARSDVVHFNDEATKDRLCVLIEGLSKRHPTMVFVPGTIAWLQPGLRSNFVARLLLEDRGKRALRARQSAHGLSAAETQGLTSARSDGKAYWLGRNTSYIYHNGKRLLKYDKRHDGGEVSSADGQRVYFSPGEKDSYFTVDGLEFCLLICAEHGSTPPRPADIQIVIASSHPLRQNHGNVRADGYLLHADAILKPSAKRFAAGAWVDVAAQARAAATPLTAAEIADRGRRGLEAMPATMSAAKGDKTIQDAEARRLATAATQLGGEIAYFALTYTK